MDAKELNLLFSSSRGGARGNQFQFIHRFVNSLAPGALREARGRLALLEVGDDVGHLAAAVQVAFEKAKA
jgi:hypothetical protein